MTKKEERWSWSHEQEVALRDITKVLADTAELQLPNLKREYVIQTDASDLGLGAVLLRQHEGVLRPVAFANRSLTPAERNYSVTEKECLATAFAMRTATTTYYYVDGVAF